MCYLVRLLGRVGARPPGRPTDLPIDPCERLATWRVARPEYNLGRPVPALGILVPGSRLKNIAVMTRRPRVYARGPAFGRGLTGSMAILAWSFGHQLVPL